MGKVLYATGLIEGGTENIGKALTQGLTVNVVESIEETFRELDENSSEYSFCMLCVKSFYASGGRSDNELFSAIQMYVTQNNHISFCFIDYDKQYNAKYNLTLSPLHNIKYTSMTKASIRALSTALEMFLQGTQKIKPVQPAQEPTNVRINTDKPTNKTQLPNTTRQKSETTTTISAKDIVIEDGKPWTSSTEGTKSTTPSEYVTYDEEQTPISPTKTPPTRENTLDTKKPSKGFFGFGKAKPAEQHLVQANQISEISVQQTKKKNPIKGGMHAFKGKTFLFTQASSCGATTVALMVAKQLAKSQLTVCYVEVSTTYASSNAILDSDFYPVSGINNRNNLDVFLSGKVTNIAECFEVCEDIHILRNNPTLIPMEWDVKKLSKQLPKMFDVVVYDITMPVLRENPLFLLSCSYKYIVTSNDYTDIMKLAIELTRQYNDFYGQENADLLCDSICKEFRVIISRYVTCEGKSRRKKEWRDVLSDIVDANEELRDIELSEISAVIPESVSISSNLFAPESTKHIVQVLEGLK